MAGYYFQFLKVVNTTYRIQRKTIIFVILTHQMEGKVFPKQVCRKKENRAVELNISIHSSRFFSFGLAPLPRVVCMYVWAQQGHTFYQVASCNLPQEKVCYLKMGTHFVVSPFHSLTMRLLKHLTFRHKYTKINEMQLHKRLDSILQG